MSSLITPARLASLVGVATGLGAAATSLAGFFTVGSAVGNGIVAAAGVLGTVATVAKFLEGQAGWEQLKAGHAHEIAKQKAAQAHEASMYALADSVPAADLSLPDETPIVSDESGQVVAVEGANGEPERLNMQASA